MSIVQRDKVLSTYNGNIESVMIHNEEGTETIQAEQGVFVTLHGQYEGKREVKKAHLTTAGDKGVRQVLLIDSPELMYNEKTHIDDFVNVVDLEARAFRLADGDVITLTEDMLPEGLAVGNVLAVGAKGKLEVVEADAEGAQPDVAVRFVVREDARNELTRLQKAWRFDIVVD